MFERIYPPSWSDKHEPLCPECYNVRMFYLGQTRELRKGEYVEHKLYQCPECQGLYKEVEEI